MKNLHSFAFCALVTPVITLGAGSVLAGQSADKDLDRKEQSTQRDQNANQATPSVTEGVERSHRDKQSDANRVADRSNMRDQSRMEHRGYIDATPANGVRSSDLVGTEVKTTRDETVGSVSDLIIDENGQVVAVVVGVGGLLGMGEKNVAIGWDEITLSEKADEQELRIDLTRENLRSAPEFEEEQD